MPLFINMMAQNFFAMVIKDFASLTLQISVALFVTLTPAGIIATKSATDVQRVRVSSIFAFKKKPTPDYFAYVYILHSVISDLAAQGWKPKITD